MTLLNHQLLREAELQAAITKHDFFINKCKKCINTKLMKKRDCDLLYDYEKPCCKLMDRFVEKENVKQSLRLVSIRFLT